MQINLTGVHEVTVKKRKTGAVYVYRYAWRGGPRMQSEPDTPDFIAEYQRLTAGRDRPVSYDGQFQQIINDYQRSPDFTDLAQATRDGYARRIRRIETAYGDLPLHLLNLPAIRGEMLDWRDQLAESSGRREADYTFAVLARIVSWAHDRRKIRENHLTKPGRLHNTSRVDIIWEDAQIAAFLTAAPPFVALPFQIALATGQRESNILALTWAAYDGAAIRLKQTKTNRWLTIPLMAETRALLDAAKARRKSLFICENSRGKGWTLDGYQSSFAKARAAAGITDRNFHDARGTAVVHLARAGCTIPEIASITGHNPKDAETILSRHYLASDRQVAESAIAKLEKHRTGTGPVKPIVKPSTDGPENTQ